MLKKKTKIIFPFYGDTVGGSHISSISLINKLKHNYKTEIIINSKKQIYKFLKSQDIHFNYHSVPSYKIGDKKINFFFKIPLIFISTIYLFLKFKPQIIHINDTRTLISWLPMVMLFNIKIIFHHRNFLPKSKFLYHFLKKIKIISNSYYIKSFLPNYLESEVVYNPIYIDVRKYHSNRILSKITLGFFGNFSKRKNPDLFIKLINSLKDEIPLESFMVGRIDDNRETEIRSLIYKNKLESCIKIIPFQNDPYKIMVNCDFIICPSVNEPFGRIPIEASLLKCLVIANDSGGFRETIQHNLNGYLVKDNNVSKYKEFILKLITDKKKYDEVVQTAYELAKKKYNLSKHFNNIDKIYKKLI